MRNPFPIIIITFFVFYGIILIKQEEEKQRTSIENLSKESKRLDKERDSLLLLRDKNIKHLDSIVNVMNDIN